MHDGHRSFVENVGASVQSLVLKTNQEAVRPVPIMLAFFVKYNKIEAGLDVTVFQLLYEKPRAIAIALISVMGGTGNPPYRLSDFVHRSGRSLEKLIRRIPSVQRRHQRAGFSSRSGRCKPAVAPGEDLRMRAT